MRVYKYNRDSEIRPVLDNYVKRLIVTITADMVVNGQNRTIEIKNMTLNIFFIINLIIVN